jgi:hypothetical protein
LLTPESAAETTAAETSAQTMSVAAPQINFVKKLICLFPRCIGRITLYWSDKSPKKLRISQPHMRLREGLESAQCALSADIGGGA